MLGEWVDFEYSVNGKMYQFSLPGGGFVSFTDLVEVLGIIGDTNSGENGDENGSKIAEITEENTTNGEAEENGINSDTNTPLTLGDVEVSEATRKFVADVASVEFSSPELVDVSKVENETTIGQIKESRGLECEYSADLKEDQIAEIDAQTVEAGDWALISILPFTSEEQLTVTMKDGEIFSIRVTDAQIKKSFIDAKGDTWEITVTYGDDAKIPDNAELRVVEILPEDEEYDQYYQQTLKKVGVVNTESEAEVAETDEDSENTETKVSNDNYAHIFDIQIWTEEHEIQPASDVSVSIKLLDAPEGENTDLQVVHFGKDGLEVMELAQNDEQNDKQTGVTELSFVTDEFSVYTVVDVNNANLANTLSNGPYALVTGIAGDPGATTGYSETYDGNQVQDYFTIIVNAQAMMDTDGVQVYKYIGDGSEADNSSWVPNVTGLAAEGVHAWTDSTGSYVGGSPTQWFFEQQSGNNYKIYTFENGRKNYVFQSNEDKDHTGTEVTTNVNGIASVSGLEAGTYKLAQKSTPAGYSMDGHTTETGTLTVVDNVTTPQTLSESLTNTALVTAGKVTLNVTDSGAGSGTSGTPIEGATFTLYKDGAVYNTGYTSNSEGKVVVGNLGAGEYYFVQTGTTADYNLPNVTRTENFTVVENPGVTQEFSQSMTNSLKGKGTVSLTLLKDSGAAISGASFQLKSGSTVLETATTGSDGTLSFSTELYEGTYTVHQVNTGSAGDDYATAADQNVAIEANSVTTQQPTLTFTNEEAAGNVTIKLWRKQGKNGYNWDLLKTYTGLKAGTEYNFTATLNSSLYPANVWYYEDESDHSNNFNDDPDDSKMIPLNASGWNNGTYKFSFTPVNNDTTYSLVLISGWGANDIYTMEMDSSAKNMNVSSSMRSVSRINTMSAPMLKTTNGITRSITHTNASPASAPEGYAEDSTFEVIEVTLPTDEGWKHTFDVQDKYDADGNPYYYYIVETDCSDDDYWIDSYSENPLDETGTITVTNKKEKTGGLTITKNVTVNSGPVPSETPTIADGTYTFTITGPDNFSYTGEIIVTNGEAENNIVLEGLTAGSYTISETSSTNVNGISLAQPQTITVAAGSLASVNVS